MQLSFLIQQFMRYNPFKLAVHRAEKVVTSDMNLTKVV